MYAWVVFFHVLTAFAWILAHGYVAGILLALRRQADPALSRTLIEKFYPDDSTQRWVRVLLGLTVGLGLLAGFMAPWWRQGWMWTALGLLLVVGILMSRFGGQYIDRVMDTSHALADGHDQARLDAFHAARAGWQPLGFLGLGLAGLAAILWLMMFKPF